MGSADINSSFPPTQWTRLIRPLQEGTPDASVALNRLCEVYRSPILNFFCRRGIDIHQAEDMTQTFITSLLRNEVWNQVDRSNGLFRCFLATRLRWFLLNHWKAARPSESPLEEIAERCLDPKATPEDSFDHSWAWTMIREALGRVESDWRRNGRGIGFEDLAGFLTTEADEGSITELSKKYRKTPNALYQAICQLRKAYAATIASMVAETVSSPSEIKGEIAYLIQCLK